MRHIPKQPAEGAIEALRGLARHRNWDSLSRARQAGDPATVEAYTTVVDSLRSEQQGLCCYCENEIDDSTGHIEHVKPRSRFRGETFDYTNLAYSCDALGDEHCGRKKKGRYDGAMFLHPHDGAISGLFTYDIDGAISAADELRRGTAEHMIQELGLQCAKLVSIRRGLARGIVATLAGFAGFENEVENIRDFASAYTGVRPDGSLHPFVSLCRQLFGAEHSAGIDT